VAWVERLAPQPAFSTLGIDVWMVPLRQPPSTLDRCRRCLSADELDRAGRFAVASARDRFLAARGALRMVLGAYLGVDAHKLRFVYGPYGKPSLAPELRRGAVHFNLSHSGELALIAVTTGRDLGIDVERVHAAPDFVSVVNHFFSPQERERLLNLPGRERVAAFFRFWTRKEAVLKGLGRGIASPLDGLDVSSPSALPTPPSGLAVGRESGSRWLVFDFEPLPGYQAAVAVRGETVVHGKAFLGPGTSPERMG
jgi:4'-phosphopantetheinyl transferase